MAHLGTCKKLSALFNVSYDSTIFQLGVSNPYNFFFLRSFFQEFSNDDEDDEAEDENTDDLHKSMTEDTDNMFNFISDFCEDATLY